MCDEKERKDMPLSTRKEDENNAAAALVRALDLIAVKKKPLKVKNGEVQLDRNNPTHRDLYEDED